MSQKRALILYTRLPCPGGTFKSRLGEQLGDQESVNQMAIALIKDMLTEYSAKYRSFDLIIYYGYQEEKHKECIKELKQTFSIAELLEGRPGADVESMGEAFQTIFGKGYDQVVMVGTDIPMLSKKIIDQAFETLSSHDLVFYPTEDKGYALIGMTEYRDVFSGIKNWRSRSAGYDLMSETKELAEKSGLSLFTFSPKIRDIDYKEDLLIIYDQITEHNALKEEYQYLKGFFENVQSIKDKIQ